MRSRGSANILLWSLQALSWFLPLPELVPPLAPKIFVRQRQKRLLAVRQRQKRLLAEYISAQTLEPGGLGFSTLVFLLRDLGQGP